MAQLEAPAWEASLLALAHEAMDSRPHGAAPSASRGELSLAYARCAEITRRHSATFHLASALLPAPKRRAVRALYAFCRITDDLVDRERDARRLAAWRHVVLSPATPANDPVALAWADARQRHDIPTRYAEQLIDAVAGDLQPPAHRSFDDLAAYGYGVASTVGLMAMHIVGFAGPTAVPYAVRLGVALQITNILRDVGEDLREGRVYLPAEELAAHGLSSEDLARGVVDDRWRRFMAFQIDRNRRLYDEAMPGIALLHRDGRLAIAAAAELYRGILDDIAAHDGDVFRRRAGLGRGAKLRRLPGIWWRARRMRTTSTP